MEVSKICIDISMAGLEGGIPRVYTEVFPSITAREYKEPRLIMEVKVIGQMDNTIDHTFESANRVYDVWGVSPTINTCGGGGLQPKILDSQIVAMRGRNPENPSDRTVGAPTEQRLEPNSQGICNTLTSVQKDNLVMEKLCISTKGKENEVASTILAGYERTNMTGFNADNGVVETVRIKQATSQGYIECEVGGVADLSYPESKTRRGRVQEKGQVSPTLMAGEQDICRIENVYDFYNNNLKSDGICGTLKSACSHNGSGTFGVIEKVGQIEGSFEQSGRVYNSKGIAPTIMSNSHGNTTGGYTPHKIAVAEAFRIRKLTPRECWRLMDFTDEDFEKAAQVNSNTQLYKQAGNSIVKNVLVAILGQMIPGKEDVYKKLETR